MRVPCSFSLPVLRLESTWNNQRGNCIPILTTVLLYRFHQLHVFGFNPSTPTSINPVDAEIQDIMPSTMTEFSFDPEPAR
jgi:hypothetical protein